MKRQLKREGAAPLGNGAERATSTPKRRVYLGIDSGVSGAWAFITESERVIRTGTYKKGLDDMIAGLRSAASAGVEVLACVELAHAMPNDGKCSVSTYIEAYGIVQGILKALNVPREFVSSNRWQKHTWDSMPAKLPKPVKAISDAELRRLQERTRRLNKEKLKEHCNEFVARRWPLLARVVAIKKNQGIADAICIALYLKRRTMGEIQNARND